MKKTRLLTAGIAALSMITAVSAGAYAADVVDFEDGNYSFASMKTDDGGDNSVLSVEDFNGSKQLKVDVQDCTAVPKVYFAINSMLDENDFDKVKSIEMDLTLESKDGSTAPGWAGGAVGTQGGEAKTPGWAQTTWELNENDKPVTDTITIQRKILLKSEKLVNGTPDTHMLVMRWGCEVDYNMYIDNIRFLDRDGNAISLSLSTSAAPAVTEEVTEAPAEEEVTEEIVEVTPAQTEEEIAPDSDNDTTSSTTGNLSALAAASALVLSFYAVSMTRRKK